MELNDNATKGPETHTPSNAADDSRRERAEEHLGNAIEHQNKADDLRDTRQDGFFGGIVNFVNDIRASYHQDKALDELGKGLHAVQDISAHVDGKGGYVEKVEVLGVDVYHHLGEAGKDNADYTGTPDKPDPRLETTRKDTIEYLERFNQATKDERTKK